MSIATSNVQSVWKLWQMSNQFEMIRSYQNAVFSVSPITFIMFSHYHKMGRLMENLVTRNVSNLPHYQLSVNVGEFS